MTLVVNLVRTVPSAKVIVQNGGKVFLVTWQSQCLFVFSVPLFSHTYHTPSS